MSAPLFNACPELTPDKLHSVLQIDQPLTKSEIELLLTPDKLPITAEEELEIYNSIQEYTETPSTIIEALDAHRELPIKDMYTIPDSYQTVIPDLDPAKGIDDVYVKLAIIRKKHNFIKSQNYVLTAYYSSFVGSFDQSTLREFKNGRHGYQHPAFVISNKLDLTKDTTLSTFMKNIKCDLNILKIYSDSLKR